METFRWHHFLCAKQDDEELQWLVDAKNGRGFKSSEEGRESAETAYHRLVYRAAVQQARRFDSHV